MHRIRRVLGKEIISHRGDRYFVSPPEDFAYDVHTFERLVADASHARTDEEAVGYLEQATALVHGDFLAREGSEWARQRSMELRDAVIDAQIALAGRYVRLERHADAAATYRAALERDPWREDLHRALMTALAKSGERLKALRHYERLVGVLKEELGVEPDAATKATYQTIRDREASPA
jgi:DNA-binding SARP family transcriptional activator